MTRSHKRRCVSAGPTSIACCGPSGTVYVGDTMNNGMRSITSTGVVTTVYSGSRVRGVAVSATGDAVYVADQGLYRLRRVTTAGAVSTVHAFSGALGYVDGEALASSQSWYPSGVAVDATGVVYVAEW